MDTIRVEILPDGTIKSTSDAISRAAHTDAEGFLAEVARLAGGMKKRVRRTDVAPAQHHHHEKQEQH